MLNGNICKQNWDFAFQWAPKAQNLIFFCWFFWCKFHRSILSQHNVAAYVSTEMRGPPHAAWALCIVPYVARFCNMAEYNLFNESHTRQHCCQSAVHSALCVRSVTLASVTPPGVHMSKQLCYNSVSMRVMRVASFICFVCARLQRWTFTLIII